MIFIIILLVFIVLRIVYLISLFRANRTMFIDTIEAFNYYGVEYWVDFGTLLGLVRNGKPIIGDNDVDICVTNTPINHERIREALTHLSKKYTTTGLLHWNAYRIIGRWTHVDIYISKTMGDRLVIPDSEPIPSHLVFPLQQRELLIKGILLPVSLPNNIHSVLDFRYGSDHMTPKRKWWFLYF